MCRGLHHGCAAAHRNARTDWRDRLDPGRCAGSRSAGSRPADVEPRIGDNGEAGAKSRYHLRGHRLGAHAVDVALSAGDAGPDRGGSHRGGRGGAAILHLHARSPNDGRPTADPTVFMQFLPRIKQATDAVINISTGGRSLMTLDERLAASLQAEPEMCSLNMGSMNFALFPMLDRPREWKHEWEPKLLEATRSTIFRNTSPTSRTFSCGSAEGCGTRFEFECYDVGHLYTLAHFLDRGLVKGAVVHPVRAWHFGRHRRGSGQSQPHEAHRRQTVRRRLSVLGAGGGPRTRCR